MLLCARDFGLPVLLIPEQGILLETPWTKAQGCLWDTFMSSFVPAVVVRNLLPPEPTLKQQPSALKNMCGMGMGSAPTPLVATAGESDMPYKHTGEPTSVEHTAIWKAYPVRAGVAPGSG